MTVPILGFITGILIGLTGTGGGSVLTPLLLLFTPYPALVVVGTKLVGFVEHWRLGKIYWRLAGYIILGSLPGSLLGILLIHFLKGHLSAAHLDASLKVFVGLALFAASLSLPYVRKRKMELAGKRPAAPQPHSAPWSFFAVGAVVGFLVAVTSVGSGSLLMVFMLMMVPLPI